MRPTISVLAALLVAFSSSMAASSAGDATDGRDTSERTALQRHVDFFDRNSDGFITVSETRQGLDAIGFPRSTSWLAANAIHIGLPKTHGGGTWWQRNTIDTAIIGEGVHGSDSGAYTADGGYLPDKYQAMFDNYDADNNDALDTSEFKSFHEGQYTDWGGSMASKAEWGALMMVAGERNDETGLKQLTKSTIGSMFDGTLFYQLEERLKARRRADAEEETSRLRGGRYE
mmetsp:Transcript_3594/g.8178  ORF Transcript_3594/g.8178 Transcript_3594/m.8178 type:complete len:230 (+) Transcript_3594:97-786(+)